MAILQRRQVIPRTRSEVFAFFEEARNLEAITPSFLRFSVVTPGPIEMKAGAHIDYRLSLFGVPFKWKTVIDEYVPGERFVDRQLKGPYRTWIHLHTFEDTTLPDGSPGTLMTDRVEYVPPLGPLGDIARVLFVDRTVRRIFDHRAKVIADRFGTP